MPDRLNFRKLLEFYEHHLDKDIMPFWMRHCLDRRHGGLNNIVSDAGVVQSTDKVMWSQGRALWTFATLYHEYRQDPAWLEAADNIAAFVMKHGRSQDGAWAFRLHADGSVAVGPQSVYVDAFMIMGLTAYYQATGNREALNAALETYRRTSPLLNDHTKLPTMPHPIPEKLQAHGPSMIFALAYHELGVATNDQDIVQRGRQLAEIVMTEHLKPDQQLLYEFVKPHSGGEVVDSDAGQTYIPGHVIESMWFMERIYGYHQEEQRVRLALDAMRWHVEKGWDDKYGGILLARHARGGAPAWHQPDAKVWWPHTEALYGLLRAYEVCGEDWCLDWYWRVHNYAFEKYPDREHGEWRQNLDRQGRVCPPVIKDFAVKDPFHLPRALIYSIQTLRRLAEN